MKFYLRVAAIVGAVLLILYFLQDYSDEKPVATAPVAASAVVTPMPTVAVAPVKQAPQQPSEGVVSKIQRAAQAARVRVSSVQADNDWFVVTVQASERNALGDFLDRARENGMRDVDLNRSGYKQFMNQGRPMHQDTYRMRF